MTGWLCSLWLSFSLQGQQASLVMPCLGQWQTHTEVTTETHRHVCACCSSLLTPRSQGKPEGPVCFYRRGDLFCLQLWVGFEKLLGQHTDPGTRLIFSFTELVHIALHPPCWPRVAISAPDLISPFQKRPWLLPPNTWVFSSHNALHSFCLMLASTAKERTFFSPNRKQ